MNFDKLTNVAVFVAATIIGGTTLYDRLRPDPEGHQTGSIASLSQQLANRPFAFSGAFQGGEEATVVLVVSKDCHFCSESMQFYKRLEAIRNSASPQFGIAALVPDREGRQEGTAYFGRYGISPDSVEGANFMALGLNGTPTLLLLDGAHRVRYYWVGRLSTDNESKVLSRLKELCAKCNVGPKAPPA